jgi:hypothetical protein
VLLGAPPSQPETEYGWIEPGDPVGWTGQGPVYAIQRFREKPSQEAAEVLWRQGSLWNTFVFAARAAALLAAGREWAPALYDRLAPLRAFAAVSAIKQYLEATAAGDKGKQDAAFKSLATNATEISRFLSGANPNLRFDTLNGLLLAHGGHHVQQIQQVHSKQYAEEAQTWNAMKGHMYVIADALAEAIAKQFPKQFI